jgi:hypothetical protein
MTAAHALLNVGFNTAIAELDAIINRRFAGNRTIRVERRDEDGWYAAIMDDGTTRFPYSPSLDTVIRFVRAFAEKEGVTVDEDSVEFWRAEAAGMGMFSLAVPVAPTPDNVVPIGGKGDA